MKVSKKRMRKIDRKQFSSEYHIPLKNQKEDLDRFEKLVIQKNEYYDQLSNEEAVLSALEKIDLPDSK